MDEWQIYRQLEYKLRAKTWNDAGSKVFATESVVISPKPPLPQDITAIAEKRGAVIWIQPLGGTADPVIPKLWRMKANAVVFVSGGYNRDARDAVLGRRSLGNNDPRNRGAKEYAAQLESVINMMQRESGVAIQLGLSGSGDVDLGALGYDAYEPHQIDFQCSKNERDYFKPWRLTAAVAGTGAAATVTLTWQNPPSRFDLYKMVLRRASGATPPATHSDGTGITLASLLAIGVVDTPGAAGTYSYSVFASYDDLNDTPASEQQYSDPATKASVVVPP